MSFVLKRLDLPPTWLLAAMGSAYALTRWAPPPLSLAIPKAPEIGWGLIGAALLLALWAAISFWRARTTVIPRETPDAIVTLGPYRFSRNPIYLADLMILIGWTGVIGSLWPLLLTPLLMTVLSRRFIDGEEAALARHHAAEWAVWSRRVRRWL